MKKDVKKSSSTLTTEEKAYLAGFLDGDGSIILQIIPQPKNLYGFQIRISVVFFQKKSRHWHILWIQKKLNKKGSLRIRNDSVSEYTISGFTPVKEVLKDLLPYLRIKRPLAKLALSIIEKKERVKTADDFLEVCKLIDKAALFTDSKRRKITSSVVEDSLKITCRDFDSKNESG